MVAFGTIGLEFEVGIEVLEQRRIIAFANMNICQQETYLGVFGFALARRQRLLLSLIHPVQPVEGPPQLKVAFGRHSTNLEAVARQEFRRLEILSITKERRQGLLGRGELVVAQLDGFAEGLFGQFIFGSAEVSKAEVEIGFVIPRSLKDCFFEISDASSWIPFLEQALIAFLPGVPGL